MSWGLPDWRDLPAAFGRSAPHPTVATQLDRRASAYYVNSPWSAPPSETYLTYGLLFTSVVIAFSVAFGVSTFLASRKWQDDDALSSLRKGLNQLSETVEDSFRKVGGSVADQEAIENVRKSFQPRIDALEESTRRRNQDYDDIDSVRKTFQQRLDALEDSIRRRNQEQDAGDNARRSLARRLEDLEGLVNAKASDHEAARTVVDSRLQSLESSCQMINTRQLDYEVINVKQQKLTQRLDSLEANARDSERQVAFLATAIDKGVMALERLDRRMYAFPTKNKIRASQRVYKKRLQVLERKVVA
jgi:chromosome segregation ATPase